MSPNRCVREGAIVLDEVLKDICVPSLDVPDLDASFTPSCAKDLFAEKSRAAWKDVQQAEARCDFAPNKVRISYRNPAFGIISLWKKSLYGRTLTDIKSDPDMVGKFAVGMNTLIRQILGNSLATGDWCIVTSPKRRHKERNFASLISAQLATLLGVNFYEDLAECHSKHRVGAVFTLVKAPPTERNIIVFDDFVTTGATMLSMRDLLQPLGYNLIFFTGINNKL
ncbi:hypothetical protein [uncultured Muribaculum sp.]|uniref:hypothetical protein n=1 Tax=uncultured Muribaculum sp. TaxID=1918613 RepID=UPI0026479311|nr:hypothetical protein [uncultured Muribaculum sp.]